MIRSILLATLVLVFSPLTHAQGDTDCRAIAAATVAELRAGYADWNDDAEQLARAAAGAACVKATTDRPVSSQGLSSTAVRANGAQQQAAVAGSSSGGDASAGQEEQANEEANEEKGEKDDDSSWNPFSDIKFNKVSASPSKKPYERRRQSLDDDEE